MNENLKISVVIPAHGRQHLLDRAIQSACDQIFSPHEVIVVDDGSPIPLTMCSDKPGVQVRLVRLGSRHNAAFARNKGAEIATGDYIAFLDSDDVWTNFHLENYVVAIASKSHLKMWASSTHKRSVRLSSCNDIEPFIALVTDACELLFGQRVDLQTSTFVVERNAFFSFGGFDDELEKHQDWDFVLRYSRKHLIGFLTANSVNLDSLAEGRMSASQNIIASNLFFSKHKSFMHRDQRIRFLGTILTTSANAYSSERHLAARKFLDSHLSVSSLPWKLRLAYYFPRVYRFCLVFYIRLKAL